MNRIALLSIIVLIAALACVVIPATAKSAKGVDLAQLKGWDIVVADDAIASEIYAAEEFQEFFRQASGLKLPIVHKITRWDKHVFIGPGMVMQASPVGFSIEDLGPEDLHIIARDSNIAIAGGRPRGALYGVYTFLEDYLGVRFLTHDHTHVPAVDRQRLIGPLDRVYRPPFVKHRHIDYKELGDNPVFAARHRINASHHWFPGHDEPKFGGLSRFYLINHSFYGQVPYQKYGKDHPEYFGLWNGKRMNDFIHTHLCLTNPDLLPIVTDAVLKHFESPGGVGRKNCPVAQNDITRRYCQCEKCTAVDKREESHMGVLLNFVNAVADEVAKTHPDVFIGTLAYGFSRKPPKNIKPRDNVQINLCSAEACQLHALDDPNCPRNVEFMRDLKKWSKICKHLYAWIYNTHFHSDYLLPYPNLHTIKRNINTLLNAGVEGAFMQSCSSQPVAEISDLRNYLTSRLLWNPKLDDREIINEFLNLHYGKAAPPIRRFIDLLHKHYKRSGIHHGLAGFGRCNLTIHQSIAEAGLESFTKAMALAENETVKTRVEKASICAYRAAIEPVWKLKKHFAVDPALPEQMRPLVKEFFRLCDKYGLGRYVAGDRQRIEGHLANQGLPTFKLPLLPVRREWRFATDPEKQGEAKQYFKTDFDDSNWTVLKEYDFWSGDYVGVGWYRQTINPPANIADKKHLYLFFGSVDEEAFVYINGEYAFERSIKSSGQGPEMLWNQPFLHDVKGLIRPGQLNVIAVKVRNTAMAGGIWQPVYLFPTDEEWTAQAIFDSL